MELPFNVFDELFMFSIMVSVLSRVFFVLIGQNSVLMAFGVFTACPWPFNLVEWVSSGPQPWLASAPMSFRLAVTGGASVNRFQSSLP